VFGGTEILVRLVAGATRGDLALEPVAPESLAAHASSFEFIDDGPGSSCRVPDDADVGAIEPADRLLIQIDLNHARFGREQVAVAHGPVVQ
jgi:hypothetical protein